ncbi:MAG TPA: hypothetical protein VF690_05100 [Hymenobacter sp.]|jgi:pimeloyl-ACP methyl ester carboxylesterase
MHALLPKSQLVPFETSDHALFIEEREKFNTELVGFMAKAS